MKDMTDVRFGRLVAVRSEGRSLRGSVMWRCSCDCGATVVVDGSNLRCGITRSCGCLMRESVGARSLKHGHKSGGRYTAEYVAWVNIIARCTKPGSQAWANYGGRGITMCKRWRNDFSAFLSDVGARPSALHSIDRIDVNGNYEPSNVRWATLQTQAKNRRPRSRNAEGRFV